MTIAYWVLAAVLAGMFLFAGGKKLVQSKDQLRPMMAWVDTMPSAGVRAIGAVEVLGAIGLIVPPLTGIAPRLALFAAIGFVVLMVLAAGFHLSRHEAKDTPINWVLIVVAAVTAWLAANVW